MRDIPSAPINFEALDANTRAQAIANVFGVRVAIVHNGNDGPGRVWETVAESDQGGFPSAAGFHIVEIVSPAPVPMLPDWES